MINSATRPEHRADERAEIERQLAEWFAKGNQVTQLPAGVSSENGHRFKATVNTKAVQQ
ncbi:hypothetical protein [Gilvimarinus agarilyticus]|uniref:hypothetical protein n=1 Tax=Gilvimarinus agarilyticus TaxID=679259 RepID=UPI0012FB1DF6|nr:hypothetical protein [Gilvimarinus agarilyticus]